MSKELPILLTQVIGLQTPCSTKVKLVLKLNATMGKGAKEVALQNVKIIEGELSKGALKPIENPKPWGHRDSFLVQLSYAFHGIFYSYARVP